MAALMMTGSIVAVCLLAYRVDAWFSTNAYAKILSLLYLTLALIYLGGLGLYAASGVSLHDAFWQAVAGAGIDWTFADGDDDKGPSFLARLMAVGVSTGGMLITALMLGIVSDTIGDKIEDMRKGKSDVLESNHSLILGWSDKVLPVVEQLCKANASEGGKPIVILAERPKEEMEEEIAKQGFDLQGSTVVCRSGSALLNADLAKVAVQNARSIIVLATADSSEQCDARMLRVVLSLMGVHDRLRKAKQGGLKGCIVCEVCDVDNQPLIALVGPMVETVVSHDIIGRLMIQCARQPGLAMVWEQLLGFDGNEFYMSEWPELVGRPFSEVLLSFPDAVPLGVRLGVTDTILLNPSDSYVLEEGDKVIVLAEDDDTYQPSLPVPAVQAGRCPNWSAQVLPERILFCGWRRDMDDLIMVLDQFVCPGSELYLYNEVPLNQREAMLLRGGLDVARLKNLRLRNVEGDPVNRKRLEELKPESFTSVLILADEAATYNAASGLNVADADSRNLASLLLLRDIQTKRMQYARDATLSLQRTTSSGPWYDNMQSAVRHTVIISEILDARTRHLVQNLQVSEFVLSNELVSMALAMVSEDPGVNQILSELFTEEGNELYIYPAARYLGASDTLSFFDVMARARTKCEIIVGYKQVGEPDVRLNPQDKAAKRLSLSTTQVFVVMAEDAVS
ncbi:hypothetical protein WJX72_008313 [[Myrmecia] bisecta]|uniref:DMI1 n=1 Tax=[Myrmecia] bisecta TaxID=41462 RepID=A0AAW1QFN1_9CHLO